MTQPAVGKNPAAKTATRHAPEKQINFRLINEALERLSKAKEAEPAAITAAETAAENAKQKAFAANEAEAAAPTDKAKRLASAEAKKEADYAEKKAELARHGHTCLRELMALAKIVGDEIKRVAGPSNLEHVELNPAGLTAAAQFLEDHYSEDTQYSEQDKRARQLFISQAIDYNRPSWVLNQLSDVSYMMKPHGTLECLKLEYAKLENLQRQHKLNVAEKKREKFLGNQIALDEQAIRQAIDYAVNWVTETRTPDAFDSAFDRLKDLLKNVAGDDLNPIDPDLLFKSVIFPCAQKMGILDEHMKLILSDDTKKIFDDLSEMIAKLPMMYPNNIAAKNLAKAYETYKAAIEANGITT